MVRRASLDDKMLDDDGDKDGGDGEQRQDQGGTLLVRQAAARLARLCPANAGVRSPPDAKGQEHDDAAVRPRQVRWRAALPDGANPEAILTAGVQACGSIACRGSPVDLGRTRFAPRNAII